ncbi:MAG TPA: PPOX class F420-dependent oxidoreductase [Anaerolineaceae bacterium]|nr:PPOX class F420-dependent oxidoreductase [Anaerolineaceae bacterium]
MVVHLPFIHRNTIGRGNRTVVDGPVVEWKGDKMIYTCVFNRMDDGKPPRKPGELSAKQAGRQHLEFIFPKLWQNYINQKVSVLAAFVPVDEDHTILYLRFYQKLLTLPVSGKLVAQLSMPSNMYIAHQDRRAVVTRQPKASGLQIGEILIQGDLPVVEYRRKRAAQQTQNGQQQDQQRTGEVRKEEGMHTLKAFTKEQYLNLETFRKNGEGVKTPVWFVEAGNTLFVRTVAGSGKVKRIRNHPLVHIAPCKMDGALLGDWMEASAREISGGEIEGQIDRLLSKKFGLMKTLFGLVMSVQGRKNTILEIKVRDN